MPSTEIFIAQLDDIVASQSTLRAKCKFPDLSDGEAEDLDRQIARCRAAIHRIAGENSIYAKQCEHGIRYGSFHGERLSRVFGVVLALRDDLKAGYLQSFGELIRGELFSDFLEMAEHLLSEGFKDAAAVIGGGSLEGHIRQLCRKCGVDVNFAGASGPKPKKADQMNNELAAAGAYSKLDQKSVTAWLDLRNKAAHGHYNTYSEEQVDLLLRGIRDFIVRHPA